MADPPSPSVTQFYLDGEPHISPGRLAAEYCALAGITIEHLGIRP